MQLEAGPSQGRVRSKKKLTVCSLWSRHCNGKYTTTSLPCLPGFPHLPKRDMGTSLCRAPSRGKGGCILDSRANRAVHNRGRWGSSHALHTGRARYDCAGRSNWTISQGQRRAKGPSILVGLRLSIPVNVSNATRLLVSAHVLFKSIQSRLSVRAPSSKSRKTRDSSLGQEHWVCTESRSTFAAPTSSAMMRNCICSWSDLAGHAKPQRGKQHRDSGSAIWGPGAGGRPQQPVLLLWLPLVSHLGSFSGLAPISPAVGFPQEC